MGGGGVEGLPDRKSVRPVSDMNLHPSMTGDSGERPGEKRLIDLPAGTIQRNRRAERAHTSSSSSSIPPSLHPRNPPLALKNRTSLNCATRRLYHSAAAAAAAMRGGAAPEEQKPANRRAINSPAVGLLHTKAASRLSQRSPRRPRRSNEGARARARARGQPTTRSATGGGEAAKAL